MRRRDLSLEIAGVLALLVVSSFVWLTRHPRSPWVARATRWPVVGGAVAAFRERWSPEPPPAAAPTPPAEVVHIYQFSPESSAPAAASASESPSRPPGPPPLETVEVEGGPAPVLPLEGRAADPVRLERIRERLAARGAPREGMLGPYRLLSDTGSELPARALAAVARSVEPAWTTRYGLQPLGSPRETVVLVRERSTYDELAATFLAGAPEADGLTAYGIVLVPVDGKGGDELATVLQHELAHLLERRSLGPDLPAWLAEGLAEDFAEAPPVADGFDFARWRGEVVRTGLRFEIHGGLAGLDRLGRRASAGAPPSLASLAAFDGFAAGDEAPERYAAMAAWIRFLLWRPQSAGAFREFLNEVASGAPPEVGRLEALLRGAAAGDAEFGRWLVETRRAELVAAGLPESALAPEPPAQPPVPAPSGSSSRQRELPSE